MNEENNIESYKTESRTITIPPQLKKIVQNALITKEWIEVIPEAFIYFVEAILPILKSEPHYPDTIHIFRALKECSPDNIKVVIVGQDPYFDGSATGLAFSNKIAQSKISPSLRKIIREMDDDVGNKAHEEMLRSKDYLGHLPSQGVLLLNTALTVKPDEASSHIELWKPFTEILIKYLNTKDNIVWILWGNYAKAYKEKITNSTHYIIEGTHPAARPGVKVPFEGGKYFSKCNLFLKEKELQIVNW